MTATLVAALDLPLAWARVVNEVREGRCFGIHPHELALAESAGTSWLDALRDDLLKGRYQPSSLDICQVPKPQGGIRPGGRLTLRDHVVYTACVSFYSERIRQALEWKDRPRDFSHPIASNPGSTKWLANPFSGWKQFGVASILRFDQGATHAAIIDIAGYYEHIDIGTLVSDLRALDPNQEVLNLLSRCLNKWSVSQVQGRGLPQGFIASDILARLYLHAVDQSLGSQGIYHYRYVDDFRIFTLSQPDARKALVAITVLLRKRGLVLNTAKSDIHTADEARGVIEGIQPVLKAALQSYVADIAELFGITDPYFSLWDAEQLIDADPDQAPIEIMHTTYTQYVEGADTRQFDKTLFHFVLNRLRRAKDPFAYPHCLSLLVSQPQETESVLAYVSAIGKVADSEASIVAFLTSAENVYAYQIFQIIQWRGQAGGVPSDDFVSYVRGLVFNVQIPGYLRAQGREFIGRFGTAADIDRLEESLAGTTSDLERAELLCAMRRMEAGRRRGIFARFRDESLLTGAADNLVRSGGLPT